MHILPKSAVHLGAIFWGKVNNITFRNRFEYKDPRKGKKEEEEQTKSVRGKEDKIISQDFDTNSLIHSARAPFTVQQQPNCLLVHVNVVGF